MTPSLYLGSTRPLDGSAHVRALELPAHHLVTHGVVVGMTGSGKTGLVTVLVEEALRNAIPVLVIDIKSDLPNLLLAFPTFDAAHLMPWVEASPHEPHISQEALCQRLAEERQRGLAGYSLGAKELADFGSQTHIRVVTPGSDAGELLHVLSSLERRSTRWDTDVPVVSRQTTKRRCPRRVVSHALAHT